MSSDERNIKHLASGIRICEQRRIEGAAACNRTTEIEFKFAIVCGLLHPSPQVSGIFAALHRFQRHRLYKRAAILSTATLQRAKVVRCWKDQERTMPFPKIGRDRFGVAMSAPPTQVWPRATLFGILPIGLVVVAVAVVVGREAAFVPCTFSMIKSALPLLICPQKRTCYPYQIL